jgi:phosphodiesterase/alkaline phosphatase D-like protein
MLLCGKPKGGGKDDRKGERKAERKGDGKGGGRNRDGWATTMGDAQYQWFRRTIEQSKAKYKFIFAAL